MLEQLNKMFAGRCVRITNTNRRIKTEEGVCKAVHAVPGSSGSFDLELENGNRFGFIPEVVTPTSVDGELRAFAGGRQKVELVRPVPASNFVATVAANVNRRSMSDKAFRQFVRRSLPIVEYNDCCKQ